LRWSQPLLGAATSIAQRECAALSKLSLPDVSISEAVAVPGRADARGLGSTDDEMNFVCK